MELNVVIILIEEINRFEIKLEEKEIKLRTTSSSIKTLKNKNLN